MPRADLAESRAKYEAWQAAFLPIYQEERRKLETRAARWDGLVAVIKEAGGGMHVNDAIAILAKRAAIARMEVQA